MTNIFTFGVRVYYEDTDTAGVVYYANYLKFAERARTEYLRVGGIEQTELMREHKVGFVVRRCEVDFLKPAKLDDLLDIETEIIEMNRVTLTMRQTIKLGAEISVKLNVKLAVVDDKMKPTRLPEFVKNSIFPFPIS